ncbi:histone-lysine N-methyltransferase SETMAR-like [Euwallacea fornicatus]|uniref:histone-lysine N-methyltransferase SETMAR-like n=1 Tax=Euwallacea fornicatus TaxID=995702 RepID=UPI0033900A77
MQCDKFFHFVTGDRGNQPMSSLISTLSNLRDPRIDLLGCSIINVVLFSQGKSAIQAQKKLCEVYGENCLTERQCQRWFSRFRSGNFNVQDAPHTGRPITIDDDKIKALVEANRRTTTRGIAEKLNISNLTVSLHLKKIGYVSKLDVWVPRELKEIHLTQRIIICDSSLNCNQNDPLLRRVVTGDEKWIVYGATILAFTPSCIPCDSKF